MSTNVEIRPYEERTWNRIVEFSLRAWQPVFESLRQVLGDAIFARLHQPDWTAVQAEAVRSSCTTDERDVFVAVADQQPVGFAAVALNAFHEGMGVVDIIAVDPAYQRRGIARQPMERSAEHMRAEGMDIAAVEPAAIPDTAPRALCTKRSTTQRCQASGISACSTERSGYGGRVREYSGTLPDDKLAGASRLWDEHLRAPFPPRFTGEDVAGRDVVLLDADVAGCVSTWLSNNGRLDLHRRDVLAQSLAELDQVLAPLTDQAEREYFARLRDLAALALGETESAPGK